MAARPALMPHLPGVLGPPRRPVRHARVYFHVFPGVLTLRETPTFVPEQALDTLNIRGEVADTTGQNIQRVDDGDADDDVDEDWHWGIRHEIRNERDLTVYLRGRHGDLQDTFWMTVDTGDHNFSLVGRSPLRRIAGMVRRIHLELLSGWWAWPTFWPGAPLYDLRLDKCEDRKEEGGMTTGSK